MPGANESIGDDLTAHLFTLLRVAGGLRTKALSHLESLFDELQTQAHKYAKLETPQSRAFQALEKETGAIIKAAYTAIGEEQLTALERVAVNEDAWARGAMNKAVGVKIFTKAIDPLVLQEIARGRILEGHPLESWWQRQSNNLRQAFTGQVSNGILLGETSAQIAARIVGDLTGPNPTPGLKKKAQNQATALARTSVMAVGNGARIESFRHLETVKGIEWLATLDGRTTLICIGLDGKKWRFPDMAPIGHDKKFPGTVAHIQCRSTQTAVTYSWEELSGKKLKSLRNKDIQQAITDELEADGADERTIAGAIAGARASMDGPVSSTHTFETWAQTKPAEFVASVIGPGRYELWNAGKITFNDLTDQNNRPLTIAQLESATTNGTVPPETLGVSFFAYQPSQRLKAQTVADAATAARKEAEEKAAAADDQARELVREIVNEQAKAYAGPFADAKAALERMQADASAADIRATYDKITEQSAPAWLNAWKNGQASPHNPDARPNRLRAEAWEKYAKGQPETAATWQALANGWQADKGGGKIKRAMETAAEALEAAQGKLAAVATAVKGGDAREIQAALLDAQAAMIDAQSRIMDAQEAAE